jgi:arylsulfatase
MQANCQRYDEFILYVDDQFKKLMDGLESSGLLKDTWVVLTSDHGELFERSIVGHGDPSLYQGVVRVPLMIFEPGRTTRTDIYSLTSAADVLPTLVHVAKGGTADWSEGIVLPPFSSEPSDPNRKVYAVKAAKPAKGAPITNATLMQIKGKYKLIYYFGYKELNLKDHVELYDIVADPEELKDLYPTRKALGNQLLSELKAKLAEINKSYL